MEIIVNENSKIVEIWLTAAESHDAVLRESLKPLYEKWHENKYTTAIFISGDKNLYEQTRDLLIYNRRRQAEKAVKAGNTSL